jgi:hypothetical protein
MDAYEPETLRDICFQHFALSIFFKTASAGQFLAAIRPIAEADQYPRRQIAAEKGIVILALVAGTIGPISSLNFAVVHRGVARPQ